MSRRFKSLLSPHFASSEFFSPEDPIADPEWFSAGLLCKQLEILRGRLGDRPIIIHSGWRSAQQNLAVGGATRSRHLTGEAADITCPGIPLLQVGDAAESLFNGLGRYAGHIHVDIRQGERARW